MIAKPTYPNCHQQPVCFNLFGALSVYYISAGMVVIMTMLKDEESETQKLKKRKHDLESEIHDFDLQLRNLRANSSQVSERIRFY